ncbi:hypothetical protein Tco_0773196 [Tanacetum coccineum]|uniref:Uncharacterized protein n=1 Tax=Tanacetum coccineum TaxID=301880 RepID=A0ABQ4ZKX8_9ASTR
MKADPLLQQQDIAIWLAHQMKFEKTQTDSYAFDDDEIPTKQVSQDIIEEISLIIDEAKLKKMADEMLRQRCTSGDKHQKEILVSPHPRKITPLVQSYQRDPEAPALSLINQDLLYLKKGNSGLEKIILSHNKFPAIVFNDDDIEERTSRWKNPHVEIFYIRRQKEPGKPKEEIYSNSKIVQVIKTLWELGHEHKFITEIVARRANDCIVSITEPDYKNLNKNDIEDMYLLIVNNKVPDYANIGLLWSLSVFIRSSVILERVHDFQIGIKSYQQKINLTAPTITFPGIEEYDVFSIVYEPIHGIIYTNSKKEKMVMRPSEIHKFCDAILKRMLEGLKSYCNDVKYGYVQKKLTNDEVKFLKLFEEEIEVRLKYQDQMRRWEMTRSTNTFDGLSSIQAQLNNLRREIKKVNKKVYAAQVGCESCKGPNYTEDYPLKEDLKVFEEAFYTQYGVPFPLGGRFRAAAPEFYLRDNKNPSYQE